MNIEGQIQDYDKKWKFAYDEITKTGIFENKLGEWTSSQPWRQIPVKNGIRFQNTRTNLFLGIIVDDLKKIGPNDKPSGNFQWFF